MNPFGGAPLFLLVTIISAIWKEAHSGNEAKLRRKKVAADRTAGSSADRSRYETLEEVLPLVSFKCKNRAPGYYADPRFECEVFHFCHSDGTRVTIPCPRTSADDRRLRHKICNLRDDISKSCGQHEIHLVLPEDSAKTKDTTSSQINSATEFKFQTVLPQPSSIAEGEGKKPTTPLSSYDEMLKAYSSKDMIDGRMVLLPDEAITPNDNPFFIEKPEVSQPLPSSFSRGLKHKTSNEDKVSFQASLPNNSDNHFLKTVYLKMDRKADEDKDRTNPALITDPKLPDFESQEDILYLLEVFNKSLKHFQELKNESYEKKSKTKQKLMDTNMAVEKKLPILHPRRRKRMAVQEIDDRRPYAIFYAKLPTTSRVNIEKPEVQRPTARIPEEPKQTVELTFDPSAIPKNLQTVPIAIRVPNTKPKRSKKKPKPQVIYENPSDVPQDDFDIPQVSEQRNFYYYYPQQQQMVANPYLTDSRQNVPAYIITSNENQRPQFPTQLEPQQGNPQQQSNNFPDGGPPIRQRDAPPSSNAAQHHSAPNSQSVRDEPQPRLVAERNPAQFQPPPSSASPQLSSGLLSQPFQYGSPPFMQNLPPPYESLPTYQNVPTLSQLRPQEQQQRHQPHQQPRSSALSAPPSHIPQLQNSPPHSSQAPSKISNENRQNQPNNNQQIGNFSPPRNNLSPAETPANQESPVGFFPSGFQSPFFQGFPPLPDFGNPFLPQPAISQPEQHNQQYQPLSPSQQPPSQQPFQSGLQVEHPEQPQRYTPPESSGPQGPPPPVIREEVRQREPQVFNEDRLYVTPPSNERKRPNRRPKRPHPHAQSISSTANDNSRSQNHDRPSRPRTTKPLQYDDEVNVVVPPMRLQRPEHTISPPRQIPRGVTPPQFNSEINVIPPTRSSRPNSGHYSVPPVDYPDNIPSRDQKVRRPESTNQFSPRPNSHSPPTSERKPHRPFSRPDTDTDDGPFYVLQNAPRLSGPDIGGEERHYYIPQNDERPSRPSNDENRSSRGSQGRRRPSTPIEGNNQVSYGPQNSQRPSRPPSESDQRLREYRTQIQPTSSAFIEEGRRPQRHQNSIRSGGLNAVEQPPSLRRPQNHRSPSGPPPSERDQHPYRTQSNRRPSISTTDEDDQRSYRVQNSRRPSGSPPDQEDTRSYRTQSTRRPSQPSVDEQDYRSYRTQSSRRPSGPSIDEDPRSHRSQNNRRPSSSSIDEDPRSHRSQGSRRPSSSSIDEDPRSHRSQGSRRPSSPSIDEDPRSHRSQSSRRPSGSSHLEDQRSSSRPQSSQRQRSSSSNGRSRHPPERERFNSPTTLPPRYTHTTQIHLPREPQSSRRPSVTVDEYRNMYYPATTTTPYPTSFAYTVPQTTVTRPAYGHDFPNTRRPSTSSREPFEKQTEKPRNYVTSPNDRGISNLVQTERSRPYTNDRPNSYIEYLENTRRPISDNQVNVVSAADGYDSRTHLPPVAESYQDYDNSRERGRNRYTTYTPITETRFQPVHDEDSSYVTYSPPRNNRHSSNSVRNEDRRQNRYKADRSRGNNVEEYTTALPRTTRKPKRIPPKPTFPSFPTFPPPPKRRHTTTERPVETTAATQSSYTQRDNDATTSQHVPPKKRLNSRPRTTTSYPVIIGTSTSVHRQVGEEYKVDEETTTRPPQKKRSRKRTRPRHRRPRPTTTMASLEDEGSSSLENRREEVVSQPTRKSYKRRGYAKSTTTTSAPTTFSPSKFQDSDSSEEYGSRIKLFGRQRNRSTSKYTPRVPSTTSRSVVPEASEPRRSVQNSASGTTTRTRRPYRKRTRTRTTTAAPDSEETTDLNIARSDENVETLKYQDLSDNSVHSTTYPEESTAYYASTEPYNEFIPDERPEKFREVTEQPNFTQKQDFTLPTTKSPTNRPKLWTFGKPKLT